MTVDVERHFQKRIYIHVAHSRSKPLMHWTNKVKSHELYILTVFTMNTAYYCIARSVRQPR